MKQIVDVEAQRQTNSRIGGLLLACGVVAMLFGTFATFIALMQTAAMLLIPNPTTAHERQFLDTYSSIQSIFLSFMPTQALLGGLLAASGWYVRCGSAKAIRIARWTLLGALGWGVAYCARAYTLLSDPRMLITDLPPPLEQYRPAMYVVQAVFAVGMLFGPPALLLFLLRRTHSLDELSGVSDPPASIA